MQLKLAKSKSRLGWLMKSDYSKDDDRVGFCDIWEQALVSQQGSPVSHLCLSLCGGFVVSFWI